MWSSRGRGPRPAGRCLSRAAGRSRRGRQASARARVRPRRGSRRQPRPSRPCRGRRSQPPRSSRRCARRRSLLSPRCASAAAAAPTATKPRLNTSRQGLGVLLARDTPGAHHPQPQAVHHCQDCNQLARHAPLYSPAPLPPAVGQRRGRRHHRRCHRLGAGARHGHQQPPQIGPRLPELGGGWAPPGAGALRGWPGQQGWPSGLHA